MFSVVLCLIPSQSILSDRWYLLYFEEQMYRIFTGNCYSVTLQLNWQVYELHARSLHLWKITKIKKNPVHTVSICDWLMVVTKSHCTMYWLRLILPRIAEIYSPKRGLTQAAKLQPCLKLGGPEQVLYLCYHSFHVFNSSCHRLLQLPLQWTRLCSGFESSESKSRPGQLNQGRQQEEVSLYRVNLAHILL